MKFEPLKAEHLPEIVQIEKQSFATPWTMGMYLPELEDKSAIYAVGTESGEVICYGGFHVVIDEADVTNIAVREDRRGEGIGRKLLAELIRLARERGAKRMTLEVNVANERALNLYRSFGFVVEGVRKTYYENRFDALLMWLTIEED